MKKFKLVACAAAVAALTTVNAFAAADMDSPNELTNAGVYVKETVLDAINGTDVKNGPDADQEAAVTFGASFATDAVAYVRFDLPAGVTFVNAPSYTVNDSAGAALVSVAQGGAGQSYVIFAVAPAQGENLVNGNTGTFNADDVKVKNNAAVSLTYKLFETLTNAANNVLPLKTATEPSFISFANAIAVVPGGAQSAVADVAAVNGAYTAFVGASGEEEVGAVAVVFTPRALVGTGTNAADSGVIVADTNDVVVTGDFTAAGAVTIGTSCAAAPVDTATLAGDKLSATFTGLTAAELTQNLVVCYQVNGSSQIIVSDYSGTVDLDAEAGFAVADGVTGTGKITRNGTILKAAFAETPAGSYSGTVNLANTGVNPAPFSTSCLTTTGRVAGNNGTVAANSSSRFGIGSVNGLGCPANTRGVELTFAVPVGNVIGSVVRQDTTTGAAGFDGMVGNQ